MRIGSIVVEPVLDGYGRARARDILKRPGTDGDPWACHQDLLEEDGQTLKMPLGGFLIRTGERVILVDTGLGRRDTGTFAGGDFLTSLAALGVGPADVTDVCLTHLHGDHIGWTTTGGEVVFRNAAYRVHQADWDHFVDAPGADEGLVRKLAPLRDRLETFTAEATLAPGLDARPAPGHTPGSTLFILSAEGRRVLLLGDIVHSVAELTEPDWEALYDVDPAAATAVRDRIADEAAVRGDLVAAPHFPGMRLGRLITVDGARRWSTV